MADEPDFAANPCCALWKEKFSKLQHKYSKLEEGRTALRRAIELYDRQNNQMQTEIGNLKKAYDEEKQHAEKETKEKEKESVTRVSLENEVSALKSEIISLHQKECSEVQCLKGELTRVNEELIRVKEELGLARQFDGEAEMNQLKDQLQEARTHVVSEKRKAKEEKKRADGAIKVVEAEKSKAYEELRLLQACGNSGETEINRLRDQLREARLQVDSEKRKAEEEKKRADGALKVAEAEKNKAYEELRLLQTRGISGETEMNLLRDQLREARLQVDSEKRKAEEEKKRADGALKVAEAEKSKACEELRLLQARGNSRETEMNLLRDQLRETRLQVDSEKKKAESEKKRADDAWKHVEAEKSRVDEELTLLRAQISSGEVEINLLTENLQEEITRGKSEVKRKLNEVCETSKFDKGGLESIEADKESGEPIESAGLCLEDEISSLKSQIHLLQQRGDSGAQNVNEELEFLRVRISEGEREIKRLNELLDKEKMRADSMRKKAEIEKKKAEAEKKKAVKAWKTVKGEKIRVDEERRIADCERKKAEEKRLQLEKLKVEADEARSKLVSLTLESEEANKKLEVERQRLIEERKSVELEKEKAEKLRKLAEINMQNALEEKNRADCFRQQLEEYRQRFDDLTKKKVEPFSSRQWVEVPVREPIEDRIGDNAPLKSGLQVLTLDAEESMSEQAKGRLGQPKQKVRRGIKDSNSKMKTAAEQIIAAEAYREKALEEKARADKLSLQLEENRRMMEDLRKHKLVLVSHEKLDEPPAGISVNVETAKMKLLKQELKLEKRQVKHAKQVVKLEKSQRKILQQELSRIKIEFKQFSHRLELCNCFTDCHAGIGHITKNGYRNSKRKFVGLDGNHIQLQSVDELLKPSCGVIDDAVCFKQCLECSAPMPPKSGNHTECTSGTTFKLQPLLRGSDINTLHSSAIDSSMASFSDNPLVGSQERCAFSISKSAERAEEKSKSQLPVSRMSGEVNRSEYNTNIAVVAENNVRSPVDACGRRVGYSKKRKRNLDAVEMAEHQFSGGKKCDPQVVVGNACMLNHMLESQIGNPSQEWSHQLGNFQANFSKKDCHRKKRSRILEEEGSIDHLGNSNVQKDGIGKRPIEQGNVCLRASSPLQNLSEAAQAGKEEMYESVSRYLDYFEELVDGNYMKLLDLDDAADEESYRLAIQSPLSSSLPEIEINDGATVETVQFGNFDTMIGDMESDKSKPGELHAAGTFKMPVNDERSKSTSVHALSSLVSKIQDSSMEREISDFGNKGPTILCGSKFVSTNDDSPQHCVVFSSISESSSLSKIFFTTRSLNNHCLVSSQTNIGVQNLISGLVGVDNLLPKEKVCVFFSLLLNNCCWYFKDLVDRDFIHFSYLSIGHMMKVMSDVETRRILAELCILDELITLIEDFLMERRVLVCSDGYHSPAVQSDRSINTIMDNGDISLSYQTASPYQLLCGAIALASVCAVYDRIGFLCEASYNIARMRKFDSSVLTALHVFAKICGSKYFALSGYSLTIDVMKSLVTFKEQESQSTGFASSHQVMPLEEAKFPLCTHCPFSKGAVSLNVLTSRLVENMQSGTCRSKTDFDGTLYDLGDVVSLLELVASNMSWDWTCDNIIVQLLVILKSHVLESALAAGLILLGQLARIGIDANGSKDSTVEKIRGKLCAFLSQNAPRKVDLRIQIVAANALLGMMSLSLEEVMERNTELEEVDCIRKWFSLLSNEEKTLAYTTFKC